jgi:hypothetical protein
LGLTSLGLKMGKEKGATLTAAPFSPTPKKKLTPYEHSAQVFSKLSVRYLLYVLKRIYERPVYLGKKSLTFI